MGQLQALLHASLFQCRPWTDGRPQPITFFAAQMICYSLALSLAEVAEYQTVMEKVRMDLGRECKSATTLWVAGGICSALQERYPLLSFLDEGADVDLLFEGKKVD